MNHLTEEQLVAHYYGDAPDAAGIEEHLRACVACRQELQSLRQAMAPIDQLSTPERSDGYGAEVWARLQPRLDEPRASWWTALFAPRRLALAGGLAVLVVAAFAAGRFWARPAPVAAPPATTAASNQPDPTAQQVRDRVLLVAVGDHLERSQMALVELMNAPGDGTVDIAPEQERARELVSENRLYRQTAAQAGENGVASVLDDLERVLVEVANSPATMSSAEFERVRERIEAQGIIFKVRVLGERVRQREIRPAAAAPSASRQI